jgi:Rrf2 family protein
MKLSTRTRYATRALLELSESPKGAPLQLKVIAARQEISVKYLEQLMIVLKSAGLVRAVRGTKGGYVLAKPAGQIRVSDVLDFLESPVTVAECVEDQNACGRAVDCVVRQVWADVEHAIHDVLDSVTLEDLAKKAIRKRSPDYQI